MDHFICVFSGGIDYRRSDFEEGKEMSLKHKLYCVWCRKELIECLEEDIQKTHESRVFCKKCKIWTVPITL